MRISVVLNYLKMSHLDLLAMWAVLLEVPHVALPQKEQTKHWFWNEPFVFLAATIVSNMHWEREDELLSSASPLDVTDSCTPDL